MNDGAGLLCSGVRSGPGAARTILLFHIISARPPKQPRMVRTFLKVHTRPRLAYALWFASNCIETHINTMQEKTRLVNQQHQASQQQAVSGLQGAIASAEVAITASETARTVYALAKQTFEEEVDSLLMQSKFLDSVQKDVANFVGDSGSAEMRNNVLAD
jgi:hypothetical protein